MRTGNDKEGMVFDVQRFSLHDGPGIRTTVFLKGCPLRCVWCHNPESQSSESELSFDAERCTRCQLCASVCPTEVHIFSEDAHEVRRNLCTACEACAEVCPNRALRVFGYKAEPEDVLREVVRDRAYYEHSGGGMTVSGGEPMMQFGFLTALLQGAREAGIDTCLDTSGFAPQEQYARIMPLADLFLFDYKATGSDRHAELTGQSNELILSNLDYICHSGAEVVLRCPFVPGVNDSPDHLAAITDLAVQYPAIRSVEVMAYHDMGRCKEARLGREPRMQIVAPPDEAARQAYVDQLRGMGCACARLG